MAFVDVDNLRLLNGTEKENWDGGDRALRAAADLLASIPGALAARRGGDEFAVVYVSDSLDEAARDLEALQA